MTPPSIIKKVQQLREKITDADYKYYVMASPDVDDYKYDMMMKELQEHEGKYPELKSGDSPTERVSGEPTKIFRTKEHKLPMLSLANSYNFEELVEFDKRVLTLLEGRSYEYVCELKFDGIAISLIYEEGKLTAGVTRGDGFKGDEVTRNIKTIRSIPLSIQKNKIKNFEVRGEIFFKKEDFIKINEEQELKGDKIFANARNTAAGTLKLKDSRIVGSRPLNFFAYYFYTDEMELKTHLESMKLLEQLKFPVNKHYRIAKNIGEVKKFCDEIEKLRDDLPYEIDGVVIKVNAIREQEILGTVSRAPRWAVAYKFKAKEKKTKLKNIFCQVGRIGTITPVADLQPVFLAGSTISRATLHNFDEIKRKDIRIGDYVMIEKGGDVIPKVTSVVKELRGKDSKPYIIPEVCPVCNTKLEKPEEEVYYYCPNYNCLAQVHGRIGHFVSRNAMEIEGLGESIIEIFLQKGYLKNYADIYDLAKHKDELTSIERFGNKSVENILSAIEESKSKPFDKVLFGLGIRHIGERTAKILSNQFGSIDNIMNATAEEIQTVHEVGPRIAESVAKFFSDRKNIELIDKLKAAGLKMETDKNKKPGKVNDNFNNKTFVLTGTLEKYKRDAVQRIIEDLGGRVSSSVSKKTDYVLAGEEAGSKLEKAKTLGVKVIDEDEFEKLVKS
ncbi:MAG: NAD-dependent DNA ligase LigA [bacterium]|nr:NAD-dependent DNA ligase LigA [bacterium]